MGRMNREELTVSVSASLARFVASYRSTYGLPSKGAVVEHALEVLRAQELERDYAGASRNVDPAWEATRSDGLGDEAC